MKTWIVSGKSHGLKTLLVNADSADEALKEARKTNPYYNTLQLIESKPELLEVQQIQYPDIDLIHRPK